MLMRRACVLLLLAAGCTTDVCDKFGGVTCLSLQVLGPGKVDQVHLVLQPLGQQVNSPDSALANPASLPVQLAVVLGSFSGSLTLTVDGLLRGTVVGSGGTAATLAKGQHGHALVTLGGAVGGLDLSSGGIDFGVDLAGGRDLATKADLAQIPCDTTTQSPCPADQKCMFIVPGEVICQPVGARKVGQSCAGFPNDDCERGFECLFPGGNDGVCTQFCSVDADCEQPAVAVGGVAEPMNLPHCIFNLGTPQLKICSLACNPVSAAGGTGCPADATCVYASGGAINELTFCGLPGPASASLGNPCPASANCATGFACVGGAAGAICVQVCRAGRDSDCTAGTGNVCKVLSGPASMFGYCCPPAGC